MSYRERAGSGEGEGGKGFTAGSVCEMRGRVVRSGLYNFDSRMSSMDSCGYQSLSGFPQETESTKIDMVEENRG